MFVAWPDLTRWWLKGLTAVTCSSKSRELLCWGAVRRVGYDGGCHTAGVGRWQGAAWVSLGFSLSPTRDFSFREVSAVLVWQEWFARIGEKIQSQGPYGGIKWVSVGFTLCKHIQGKLSLLCSLCCPSQAVPKPVYFGRWLSHLDPCVPLYWGTSLILSMWSVHTISCPGASAEVLNYSLPQGVTYGCSSWK